MGRLVLYRDTPKEEDVKCLGTSTTYGLEAYPDGRLNEITIWIGKNYIVLSRTEAQKLKNSLLTIFSREHGTGNT